MLRSPHIFREEVRCCFSHFDTCGLHTATRITAPQRRTTSRGALHPQPSFAPPRDSVCCIWLVISGQLDHGLLLVRLLPNANEFGLHLTALSSRDGREDIALFMRPASSDEAWTKTRPRQPRAAHHAHRSR